MTKVYKNEKSFLDFMHPVEKIIFKFCGINPRREMGWKEYIISFLIINLVWLIWAFIILVFQKHLLLNPAGNSSMEWTLAINSAISFLTSTNLQHYAGETGATYFSQIAVFMFLQFVSAGTSLAVGVAAVRVFLKNSSKSPGNFYSDFVKSITRILLPICIVTAIIFLLNGVPMTFQGPEKITGLQGDTITLSTGQPAAFIPIKELGSNGGGYFGANDAHPFENPNFFTFIIHTIIVFLLPMAFVIMIGYFLMEKKFTRMLFGIMTAGFIFITVPIIQQETSGNPAVHAMGINTSAGNTEGKEVRFGSFYSAFYCGENVIIPAGTLTSMHDSYMPLSDLTMLLAMNTDAFFGGLGIGWINMFMFLLIAVFIGTIMIGRTPELFGRKIGIPEIQIAAIFSAASFLIPVVLTAIASFIYINHKDGADSLGWLSNKGPHGFTTFLYEYISSVAGNGSEFSGLGNNTAFWNLSTSIAMLTGRFVPVIGALLIASLLQKKKYIPPSSGTLKTEGLSFGIFLFAVIIILNALSLFVPLILGPINEHFLPVGINHNY
jgi:K+-transporting ATPase ATPase A chain